MSWSAEAVADMEWILWKTAATTRSRPPEAAAGERNEPIWNAAKCQPRTATEICCVERENGIGLEATSTSDKPDTHERSASATRRWKQLRNSHEWTTSRRLTLGTHP